MGEVIRTNPKYWLEKRASRRTGFPMATVAYYGENDQSACKVVVGIFAQKGIEEPVLKKWFLTEGDIRSDEKTTLEIVNCLQEHNVERVSMIDRIFGCPHEEGIDYPDGETCPQCPFWENRDRFTGQLI